MITNNKTKMASHYKWYPSSEEVIVPFNARYSFPSQANKAVKITPRIPPQNGQTFTPGQIIRLQFPAQGYVNPLNTTIEFDVELMGYGASGATGEQTRFQNNIQSIFNRVRLLYGATPLEDIINYNVVVRNLTEWTATDQVGTMDQTSVAEGIGGVVIGNDLTNATVGPTGSTTPSIACTFGLVNVRQNYIQGIDTSATSISGAAAGGTGGVTEGTFIQGSGVGSVPNQNQNTIPGVVPSGFQNTIRRYQVNLALGLFTQDKLLPVKWMASQLAIEITLEQPANCIISNIGSGASVTSTPTYAVGNVNLIPEILEFDASYDAMFLKGLRDGGVPLKFSSWHTFIFSASNQANVQLLVQERSRSVKALFAVQRRATGNINVDSHACFFDTSQYDSTNGNTLQNYQYRIGGRYFPAQPVQCSLTTGGGVTNGGAEAYVELQKALNIVGDYRLKTGANTTRWAMPPGSAITQWGIGTHGAVQSDWQEFDYMTGLNGFNLLGQPAMRQVAIAATAGGNSFNSNIGSACFTMATDLETSNGVEISGLNAEEQSDIALIANWRGAQGQGYSTATAPTSATTAPVPTILEVYSYYDAMIILRENNVLELIQ